MHEMLTPSPIEAVIDNRLQHHPAWPEQPVYGHTERVSLYIAGRTFAEYTRAHKVDAIMGLAVGANFLTQAVVEYWQTVHPTEPMPSVSLIHPPGLQTKQDILDELNAWNVSSKEPQTAPQASFTTEQLTDPANVYGGFLLSPRLVSDWNRAFPEIELGDMGRRFFDAQPSPPLRLQLARRNSLLADTRLFDPVQQILHEAGTAGDTVQHNEALVYEAADHLLTADKYATRIREARDSEDAILVELALQFPELHNTAKRILLLDMCTHSGTSLKTVQKRLGRLGNHDIRVGLFTTAGNNGDIVPDVYAVTGQPEIHYVVGKDYSVTGSATSVVPLPIPLTESLGVQYDELTWRSRQRYREMGIFMGEYHVMREALDVFLSPPRNLTLEL